MHNTPDQLLLPGRVTLSNMQDSLSTLNLDTHALPTTETGTLPPARRFGRKAAVSQDAPASPVEQSEVEEPGRFAAARLTPVEGKPGSPPLRPARQAPTTAGAKRAPKRVWSHFDRALLAVEVLSALVVAWLVGQYIYTVYFAAPPPRKGINTVAPAAYQTATARAMPGLILATATPTLFAEVAPPLEGPPPGQQEEQPPAPQPTATATIEPVLLLPTRLRIPVMFLDSPVHEVTVNMGEWEVSPLDIGHHEGTANPGETGNVVLAGHRDINSALFRELDRLEPGDEVFVENSLGEYRYIVQESFVVSPEDNYVMDPTTDKRLTLITCTPIGLSTQRLVVTALLDRQGTQQNR